MAKIKYAEHRLSASAMFIIEYANKVIQSYQASGLTLSLRQLYYQFVAENAFTDTYVQSGGKWVKDPDGRDVLLEVADCFAYWKWEDQPHYVEVWVEKDALLEVVAQTANRHDVAYFSCRGYTSVTELHAAALRLRHELQHGKFVHILHIGDHDPSGLDMTRNITERLQDTFQIRDAKIHRIALNRNQIDKYNPPPNPAKLSDSRSSKYVERHGEYSWEVDALRPDVLSRIIDANIDHWKDKALWAKAEAKETRARNLLKGIYDRWNDVYKFVTEPPKE